MNYYNENDPKACAWLKALIAAGLIPQGHIDQRSIVEVAPADLQGFAQCHFFAGIAGWPYALHLAQWPEDRPVWTASCPCQPLSCAGLGKGHADERHLWPAFYRLVAERKPATIVGEQVASKIGREWFAGIRADLEGMGYAVGGADLCSASVGAPNIRQRLYWVAESERAERRPQYRPEQNGCDRQDIGRQETHSESRTCGEVRSKSDQMREYWQSLGEHIVRDFQQVADHHRMGEPVRARLEGHAGNGDDGDQSRRIRETTTGSASTASDVGGMGDTEINGHEGRSIRADRESSERITKAGFSNGGVGEPNGNGRETGSETTEDMGHRRTADSANFWSDSRWHLCRDGKHRRIPLEPAFFPLAARIPGRVAALRGYGNAINPQIAAEFIKAISQTLDMGNKTLASTRGIG